MKFSGVLISMLMIMSCKSSNPHYNQITKIELAKISTWTPSSVTIIDSTLTYKFYGTIGNKKPNFYTGIVSDKFWSDLNRKSIHFKTIYSKPYLGCKDCTIFDVNIHWKNGDKRILRFWEVIPDSLVSIFLSLDSIPLNTKPRPSVPFKFETAYPFFSNSVSVKFPTTAREK